MTLLEAARQALEPLESALEYVEQCINERVRSLGENYRPHVLAGMRKEHADGLAVLAALRAAIEAAAEPEPVAWTDGECLKLALADLQNVNARAVLVTLAKDRLPTDVPLYTAPPSADAQTERDAARLAASLAERAPGGAGVGGQTARGEAVEAQQVAQHRQKLGPHQVAALGKHGVEVGAVPLQRAFAVLVGHLHRERHVGFDSRHLQLFKQGNQPWIRALVVDQEAGVHTVGLQACGGG